VPSPNERTIAFLFLTCDTRAGKLCPNAHHCFRSLPWSHETSDETESSWANAVLGPIPALHYQPRFSCSVVVRLTGELTTPRWDLTSSRPDGPSVSGARDVVNSCCRRSEW
jgi:hypothetical protein